MASAITRRVTSSSISSLGGSEASAIGVSISGEPSAIASASRCTSDGTRSSRASTSSTVVPSRSATRSIMALSRSRHPSSWAMRAATSEPPDPYLREIVTIPMAGSTTLDRSHPEMLDDAEAERAPGGAGQRILRRIVQSQLGQAALDAPFLGGDEERTEHTVTALAGNDEHRRDVPVARGVEERRANGVGTPHDADRCGTALREKRDLILEAELRAEHLR